MVNLIAVTSIYITAGKEYLRMHIIFMLLESAFH